MFASSVAAARPFSVSPAMLHLLLVVLSLIPSLPVGVQALQCYDCLSRALPDCTDGSRVQDFDKIICKPDETFCSLLIMNDTTGQQFVSRQCASRPDEGDQLKNFIQGTLKNELQVVRFVTCEGDLCNTQSGASRGTGSFGNAGSSKGHEGHAGHEGHDHSGHTTHDKGAGGGGLPSALPSAVVVSLALIGAAFVRPRA